MTFSVILEVTLGMIVFFYILSLIVSSITSKIAEWIDLRAYMLEGKLKELLKNLPGVMLDQSIKNLEPPKSWMNKRVGLKIDGKRITLPGKIPTSTLATALFNVILPDPDQANAQQNLWEKVSAKIDSMELQDTEIGKSLKGLLKTADDNIESARKNAEEWFDNAMTLVSARYRKWSRRIAFVIALLIVGIFNADTITVVNRLWQEPTFRAQANALADQLVTDGESTETDTQSLVNLLDENGFQLFWTGFSESYRNANKPFVFILNKLAGLAITWFALSLGASFWYDMLKQLKGGGTPSTENG